MQDKLMTVWCARSGWRLRPRRASSATTSSPLSSSSWRTRTAPSASASARPSTREQPYFHPCFSALFLNPSKNMAVLPMPARSPDAASRS
eukprot:3804449-Rhodomonas_salina.2